MAEGINQVSSTEEAAFEEMEPNQRPSTPSSFWLLLVFLLTDFSALGIDDIVCSSSLCLAID
jgi:hypothetical protein